MAQNKIKIFLGVTFSLMGLYYQNNVTQNNKTIEENPELNANFQYQVAISIAVDSSEMKCGGAIITSNQIVTAAHCVMDETGQLTNPENVSVKAGSIYIDFGTILTIAKIIVHPKYNKDNFDNDIAVLITEEAIEFNANISSISLNKALPDPKENCIVSGWLSTDPKVQIISPILLHSDMHITSHDSCKLAYQKIRPITQSMICVQNSDGSANLCLGDSGGPLVCNNTLTGIISWGYRCGDPKYPSVCTSIASVHDWLKSIDVQTNSSSKLQFSMILIYFFFAIILIYFN